MKRKEGSLNFVLLGDWNRMFCTPEYISGKIFTGKEVILEVVKQDQDFQIRCRCNNLLIIPTQSRIQMICLDLSEDGIKEFDLSVRKLFSNIFSPQITAYGFNVTYEEESDEILPGIFDNISFAKSVIERGAKIHSSSLKQTLEYKDKKFMFDYTFENGTTTVLINQHNDTNKTSSEIQIKEGEVMTFLEEAEALLSAEGYSLIKEDEL